MNQSPPETGNEYSQNPVHIQMPERKPIITMILIGLSVIFFILQHLVQLLTGADLLFLFGGKINEFIMAGQIWRLFTPALLHGSILHIAFNMYALFILGRRLERFYGHSRFFLLYIFSAFAGNVLSFVLTPAPSLGASTAIFGLLAAEGMFIFQNRTLFGPNQTRQAMMNLAIILMINLSLGFSPGTNIDNMGHIGGLIGGLFFAAKAGPLLQITGQPPFLSLADKRKQGDVILASLVVTIGFSVIALIPYLAI